MDGHCDPYGDATWGGHHPEECDSHGPGRCDLHHPNGQRRYDMTCDAWRFPDDQDDPYPGDEALADRLIQAEDEHQPCTWCGVPLHEAVMPGALRWHQGYLAIVCHQCASRHDNPRDL